MQAIIIGSGHNSLVCACYLASAGWEVTVVEARSQIGGATATEDLAPGFRVSAASYSLSLLDPDIHRDLQLDKHGLEILPKDPQLFVPFPDGSHLFIWRDAVRTRSEIERIHRPDADAYVRYGDFLEYATNLLRQAFTSAGPPTLSELERGLPSDVWRLAVAGSAAELVEHFFESDKMRGTFASQGLVGTRASVDEPGTAWVLTYHAMGGQLVGASGTWAYVKGGMGSVADALSAVARERGVGIRTESAVARVIVEAGRASGVELSDGTQLQADVVVSGAEPKRTFLGLVGEQHLPSDFVEKVNAWRTDGAVVKVNLALSGLPQFSCLPGNGPQHRGTIEVSPSLEYLRKAWSESSGTTMSTHPWMEVFIQSTVDETLAGDAGHVLSAFTQYAPHDLSEWDANVAGDTVIAALDDLAPGTSDLVVARDVLGPKELEDRFGLTGGDIFHGSILPGQCFANRFDYATPLPGLFLCGSGARPGGAVTGIPGRNAARVITRPA